jgi:hypothetical protein
MSSDNSTQQNQPIAILPKNSREEVRITLGAYKGVERLDIRVFADINGLGVYMPTKKGVSIKVNQLRELIAGLEQAEAEASKHGVLSERPGRHELPSHVGPRAPRAQALSPQ